MRLPAYPAYKDSGVEWLGAIPCQWVMTKVKYIGDILIGLTYSPNDVVSENEGLLVLRSSNVQNAKISLEDNVYVNVQVKSKLLVKSGDILVCARNGSRHLIGKSALIESELVGCTFGAFMTIVRSKHSKFLYYVLNSALFTFQSSRFLTCTINQLTTETLGGFEIPLPPENEQNIISKFLDYKTAQIDALIAKKEALLAKLAEKRTALISHAVTKGLDPSVPMKDSGVEWLGDVPKHWGVLPLKFAIMFQRGHDLPADDRIEGDIPLVSSSGVSSSHDRAMAKGPGIVTGRYGTIGKFTYVESNYWPLNTTLYSIKTYQNNEKYLWFMLHLLADLFILNSKKGAVPGIDRNDLHPVLTVMPPRDEQDVILGYLEKATSKIDQHSDKVCEAIEKLREYRSALITNAVTGKIDVRSFTSPEEAAHA